MRRLIFLIYILLFTSCSSYVKSLHKQINRENNAQRAQVPQGYYNGDPQFNRSNDRRPIQDPKTLGGYPSARAPRNVYPKVKRNYGQSQQRVRADDLKDNDSDGSLWSGKNSESFLFVTNNFKKPGDIVIIDVMAKLKDDITEELKRAYPDAPKKKKADEAKEAEPETPAAAQATPAEGTDKKVHDKISTQVVESVNKDYLLLRGRKEVLFKNAKRYVEVQALVSKKDIADNDTVKSNRILEPKIRVLRY